MAGKRPGLDYGEMGAGRVLRPLGSSRRGGNSGWGLGGGTLSEPGHQIVLTSPEKLACFHSYVFARTLSLVLRMVLAVTRPQDSQRLV